MNNQSEITTKILERAEKLNIIDIKFNSGEITTDELYEKILDSVEDIQSNPEILKQMGIE
jgi:hypothetical protein